MSADNAQTQTAEPIDILAIAAQRLHTAQGLIHRAQCMNCSPEAGEAYQNALVVLGIAHRDMSAARNLALELCVAALKPAPGSDK